MILGSGDPDDEHTDNREPPTVFRESVGTDIHFGLAVSKIRKYQNGI